MRIEIYYEVKKTASVEVDDSYKEMVNDDDTWDELIKLFSETVVRKIREIENNTSLDNNNIFGVFDAETGDVIYEN